MRMVAARRRLVSRPDVGSYWISFSDMLSSLLLVFILALMVSIYQYYTVLSLKTRELETQRAELDRTQIVLAQKIFENLPLVGVLQAVEVHESHGRVAPEGPQEGPWTGAGGGAGEEPGLA